MSGNRVVLLAALGAACSTTSAPKSNGVPLARATELARSIIVADGHIDLPYRMRDKYGEAEVTEDLTADGDGDFDLAKATAGGLDAPFMSIYVPARFQEEGGAKAVADGLIDMVEGFAARWPDRLAIARSPEEVEAAFSSKKVALPLGIENGAALEDDLANITHFHGRGVRYITLTHSKDNQICDSSYDDSRTWKGLSPFGRQVVEEMNRVGIMIDISHVSDDAFFQTIELTKVPVIASHSSCRKFTPGFERNMSDEMIKKLAENGGVILINFGSTFLRMEPQTHFRTRREAAAKFMEEKGIEDRGASEVKAFLEQYDRTHPPVLASVDDVADHIDHVAKLVGVDHVGFGSDFDGVGDSLPVGLEDSSKYPVLIQRLLERGYSEADIEKIASKNLLRVWRAVAAHAAAAR